MTHKPSIGRIVHYYQGDYEAPHGNMQDERWTGTNGTRFHPAIITRVFTDDCVNLQVFFDAQAPGARSSVMRIPDEMLNGMHIASSGWRWPERV